MFHILVQKFMYTVNHDNYSHENFMFYIILLCVNIA